MFSFKLLFLSLTLFASLYFVEKLKLHLIIFCLNVFDLVFANVVVYKCIAWLFDYYKIIVNGFNQKYVMLIKKLKIKTELVGRWSHRWTMDRKV